MKILLIGPPASGKGTVGKRLAEELKLPFVSTGDILRALEESHPFYNEIHEAMDKGALSPNNLVGKLLAEEFSKDKYLNGFILDGWGRKPTDLDFFDPNFDLVFYIKISDETVIKRISGRRKCKTTGETFNIYTNPAPKDYSCPDGWEQRADDTEEAAKIRVNAFHNETVPAIENLRMTSYVLDIDGEPAPDVVFENCLKAVRDFLKGDNGSSDYN